MIDFDGLSARLIPRLRELLPQWFPEGKFRGREFVVGNVRGEPGQSLSVNLDKGIAKDFATGESFSDPIALFAAARSLSMSEAARELGGENVPRGTTAPSSPTSKPNGAGMGMHCIETAPEDAPEPTHPREYPPPTAIWKYRNEAGALLFLIARYDVPGQRKQFLPYTWQRGKWMRKGYPVPRPLYRLPELISSELPVLIVEGEKCADVAAAALPSYAVVTWPHGAKNARAVDWSAVKGRSVTIWPDADDPGREAAAQIAALLLPTCPAIKIVRTEGRPEGWDIADALSEGTELEPFLSAARLVTPHLSTPAPEPPKSSVFISWAQLGLAVNANGSPHANIANVTVILKNHPDFAGKIWLDSFRGRVYHTLRGPTEQWTDADDSALTVWIQQQLKLAKMGLPTVSQGVFAAASAARRNSLKSWLKSLQWDGTPRLRDWLCDYLGVARTEYTMAVAQNWLVSMIARAFKPGCQVDTMPVLEGMMGRGKSSALALLGGEWYAALPDAFGSRDFLQAIQGTWLVEIPDLAGFSKREHSHIIAIITNRSDRYRAAYGRWVEDHERQCVFAATSEKDDYLSDSRGIRRYWPLRISHIDLDALAEAREQLFAEAVIKYQGGAGWYDTPVEETRAAQIERRDDDPWTETVMAWCCVQEEINVGDVLTSCLQIEKGRQTQIEKRRVASILRDAGWRSLNTYRHGSPVKLWRNPRSPERPKAH